MLTEYLLIERGHITFVIFCLINLMIMALLWRRRVITKNCLLLKRRRLIPHRRFIV